MFLFFFRASWITTAADDDDDEDIGGDARRAVRMSDEGRGGGGALAITRLAVSAPKQNLVVRFPMLSKRWQNKVEVQGFRL